MTSDYKAVADILSSHSPQALAWGFDIGVKLLNRFNGFRIRQLAGSEETVETVFPSTSRTTPGWSLGRM